MNKYTIDYFIDKFTQIPEEKWTTGTYSFGGKCCALGHCGYGVNKQTEEATALDEIFAEKGLNVIEINDDKGGYYKFGKTPRLRIINALKSFKK